MTNDVLEPLVAARQDTLFYDHGMSVFSWPSGAIPRPSIAYLASVPISSPLIGLIQLVRYLVVGRVSGLTPEKLRERITGATGHSQGLVSAIVIAASTGWNLLKKIRAKLSSGYFSLTCMGSKHCP
jgi:fatty acid synthase subunit alpha